MGEDAMKFRFVLSDVYWILSTDHRNQTRKMGEDSDAGEVHTCYMGKPFDIHWWPSFLHRVPLLLGGVRDLRDVPFPLRF